MGINDRKEREKEELKQRILNAAVEIFRERGFENTSIRAIADKIEYSPTTIYLYYKDKNALFHDVHEEGFRLMQKFFAPLAQVADPFERLLLQGRYYMDFATRHPEFYDLMFLQKAPIEDLEGTEAWHEGESAFGYLVSNIQESIDKGQLMAENAEVFGYMLWSVMHGMVSLMIKDRCNHVISEPLRPHINQLAYDQFIGLMKAYKRPN